MEAQIVGKRCLRALAAERKARYANAGVNPQVVWTNGTLASSLAVGTFRQMVTPWCDHRPPIFG